MRTSRPNVILFTTDQHRGDHLGIASHPVVETPNIDSFVNHGAYLPNTYSEIPSTTGARRCLMAGQGSYACGLVGYSSVEWHEHWTLAQILADAGYHCINIGFRNMHPPRKLYGFHRVIPHDLSEGNDDYMEWLRERLGPDAYERAHGCDANGWACRPWNLPEEYHPTNWLTVTALKELRHRDPTRPFFLWLSHMRPHSPYDPPQAFWDMYIDRSLPPPCIGEWASRYDRPNPGLDRAAWFGRLAPMQLQRMRAAYMASITHIDYQLGFLLEELRRNGLDRDTLWVFTSDHGDMMGDHHLLRKTYAYEGSARILLLIRYPYGSDLPCGVFPHVAGLQDVMPTILDIVGLPIPKSVTGMSLVRALRGQTWREFLHGEHSPCYSLENAMQYLTDGKTKYVWFPVTGEEQLFDLDKDRGEIRNLANDPSHRERLEKWRRRLVKILAARPDGFSDGQKLLQKDTWSPVAQGKVEA